MRWRNARRMPNLTKMGPGEGRPALAALPGATRQREMADRAGSLEGLVEALSDDFARAAAESSLAA